MTCHINTVAANYYETRLAAISNYKLALITFTSPNNTTLRRTALIKNLSHQIYLRTPAEALEGMVRWEFFRPESFESMTQSKIEAIVQHYLQIIQMSKPNVDEHSQQQRQQQRQQQLSECTSPNSVVSFSDNEDDNDFYGSLFCTSDPNIRSLESVCSHESEFDEELWSLEPGHIRVNRVWPASQSSRRPSVKATSISRRQDSKQDVTNDVSTITLASELMNLFDMDFDVDLSLPSPKRYEFFSENGKIETNNSSTSLHNVFNAYEIKEDQGFETNKGSKNKNKSKKVKAKIKSKNNKNKAKEKPTSKQKADSTTSQEPKSSVLQKLALSARQNMIDAKNQASQSFSTLSRPTKSPKTPQPKLYSMDPEIQENQKELPFRPTPLPKSSTLESVVLIPPQRSSSLAEVKALPIPGQERFMPRYRSSSLSQESLVQPIPIINACRLSIKASTDFDYISKSNIVAPEDTLQKKKKKRRNPLKKFVNLVKKSGSQQELAIDHQDVSSCYSKSIPSSYYTEESIPHSLDAPIKQISKQFLLLKESITSNILRHDHSRPRSGSCESSSRSSITTRSIRIA
ncbi:hypothetical protein BD560DRAFT_476292 [Blakeslea trispora]|nr:hypothetical protein BD560DRAFT_476292 [Blakeslea trispora]